MSLRWREAGFTLIELMVVLGVLALLALKGVPALTTYVTNSRIGETANVVVTTAALARNEAIKRNSTVTLVSDGSSLSLTYLAGTTVTSIRSLSLASVPRVGTFTAAFDSSGRLTPFGTDVQAVVDNGAATACGGDILCPIVHIEAGGLVGVCKTGTCP